MSRAFSGTDPKIDLGDLASTEFGAGVNWTVLVFFKSPDAAANDALVSKWGGNPSTNRQFVLRLDTSSKLGAYFNNAGTFMMASTALSNDTWYLAAVSNDTSNNVAISVYNMSGTLVSSGSGTHPGDVSSLNANVTIGTADNNAFDPTLTIAHVAYVDVELSAAEILAYLRRPAQFVVSRTTQFYLPLRGDASPEPDFSGNAVSGTISGTVVKADNPPSAVWIGVAMISVLAAVRRIFITHT